MALHQPPETVRALPLARSRMPTTESHLQITVQTSSKFPSFLSYFPVINNKHQGWDPLLLISQIISLQSLHYLTLSLLVPLLLSLLAHGPDLDREGGPANVAMLMDWRLFAGQSTVPNVVDLEWVSSVFVQNAIKRSWALAVAWVAASAVECVFTSIPIPNQSSTSKKNDGPIAYSICSTSCGNQHTFSTFHAHLSLCICSSQRTMRLTCPPHSSSGPSSRSPA